MISLIVLVRVYTMACRSCTVIRVVSPCSVLYTWMDECTTTDLFVPSTAPRRGVHGHRRGGEGDRREAGVPPSIVVGPLGCVVL